MLSLAGTASSHDPDKHCPAQLKQLVSTKLMPHGCLRAQQDHLVPGDCRLLVLGCLASQVPDRVTTHSVCGITVKTKLLLVLTSLLSLPKTPLTAKELFCCAE